MPERNMNAAQLFIDHISSTLLVVRDIGYHAKKP